MSYLQMLQQARQQDAENNARIWSALGNAALTAVDLKMKGDERMRTQAQQQAELLQKMGGAMLQANQGKEAAGLLPKFRDAVKTGYGLDLPSTSVVGAPVMGQVPNPDFIGPMPKGQTAMKVGEVGRDFNNPASMEAIRGGLMLERPKAPALDLFKASPYENVIDTRTGKVVLAAQNKPEAEPRARLVPSYNPDGTVTYVEASAGTTVKGRPQRAAAGRDSSAEMRQWQTSRIKYVESYLKGKTSQLPMVMTMPDPEGTGTITLERPFRQAPTPEQIEKWRKEAESYYDTNVTRPFEQPGSGAAASAVRGVPVKPPTKASDVSLLPTWEKLAQQAASLAPGAVITSRARSKERNAAAGGVADSWHQQRQAFDLAGVKPADKPKLIQWGRKLGLEVLDEGDHLHFEPARSSSADPKLRDFYARHGLEDTDNA